MSPDDVAQWLALFGGEPDPKPGKKKKVDRPKRHLANHPLPTRISLKAISSMWLSLSATIPDT
ncbi:MAG: hypothetical protein M9930_03740 [Anaerolineae bacterium]|nr:hypothetical protein [Anaerolineae bacterium]